MTEKGKTSLGSCRITITGGGYVGLSLACLLSEKNQVTLLDVDPEKVRMIGRGVSPLKDEEIERYLRENRSRINVTTDESEAYSGAEIVIIAVPTDFDEEMGRFDTDVAEWAVMSARRYNEDAMIVIRSTVPVGFTEAIRKAAGGAANVKGAVISVLVHELYDGRIDRSCVAAGFLHFVVDRSLHIEEFF